MLGIVSPREDQIREEEKLWQEADRRIHEYYGEKPPAIVLSRFEAERQLFAGTGLIEHYELIDKLYDAGIVCTNLSDIQVTFTGWLMHACDLNPLPPHTVCPSCKQFVYHPEVKDGWDLPDSLCDCGEEIWCDGHDIPLYFVQRKYTHLNRKENVAIVHGSLEELKSIVEEQYHGRWHLVEYLDAETQLLNSIFGDSDRKNFALLPNDSNRTNAGEGFPEEPLYQSTAQSMATIIYITIVGKDELSERTDSKHEQSVCADEIFSPETMSYAWGNKRILSIAYGDSAQQESYVETDDLFDPPDILEDLSPYLPTEACFSDLVKLKGIHMAAQAWPQMLGPWVKEGTIQLGTIPMSLEDIFLFITQHLSNFGICDNGIADHIFACILRMKPKENTAKLLHQCTFNEWFIKFILYEIQTQDIADKKSLIYCAVARLKTAYKQRKNGEPIRPVVMRTHYAKQSLDVETALANIEEL